MKIIHLLLFFFLLAQTSIGQKKFDDYLLNKPKKNAAEFESQFLVSKLLQYSPSNKPQTTLLENGYASAQIRNAYAWKNKNYTVDTVKVIYTNYPADKNFWLTDYHFLLAKRLKELFRIDSLFNNENVIYEIVLQTGCKTDAEARSYFHGFEIIFHQKESLNMRSANDTISAKGSNTNETKTVAHHSSESKRISGFINSNGGLIDSTVIKVLERHRNWKNALVVMDWTGSMYPYGGQAVLWHSLNFKTSGLKYFVFFNDGNNEPRKRIGRTGGIYFEKGENLKKLATLLTKVKVKGNGGDTEENDLEAIIKGIQKFPDFSELILIADNNSCIRDFCLIKEINVPVKIILCGAYTGINPQFLNLAYKTNGSIHTIEEDIYDLYNHKISNATWMIDGTEYRFNTKKDLFEYLVEPDKDDPHNCEPFYKKKKCKCEKIK